jgi:hypothetical protein
MTPSRTRWLVIVLALTVPLGFAAFTGHAWEDYFITLRASRNLAEGHGLVFNPGERVHTFTSPLGVLIPALCTWLTGPNHEDLALWLYRALDALVLAATAALLWRRASTLRLGAIGQLVLFGLLITDAKLTDFAINGMETALLVFFTLGLWSELESPGGPHAGRLALVFGGLMWTRPDAFVLAGAILVPHLVFREQRDSPASARWGAVVRGALLGGLIYLPWFAWAWWYYGTPVPHTIIAKGAVTPPLQLSQLLLMPWRIVSRADQLFLPTYQAFGGWPGVVVALGRALSIIANFAWLVPGWSRTGRRASLTVFIGAFYLNSIIAFPWYVPPWTALAIIALAWGWDALMTAGNLAAVRTLARLSALVVIILYIGVLAGVAWQMRVQQRVVEDGVRRPIGEWLRAHAAPDDTVFLEPLGYIGYFSQLKTYDFPGLSSPEVVAQVRSGARDYSSVIERLRPRWVVLRPFEIHQMEFSPLHALDPYDVAERWSARARLDAITLLPGRRWCEWESEYVLYRRRADDPKR